MFPQQIKKEKIDMDKNKQLDKIRGSLVGGAVGDALGYQLSLSTHTTLTQGTL